MYQLKFFMSGFLSLFAIMRLTGMSTKNPVSILLFIIFVYIFSKLQNDLTQSHIKTADPWLAGILGVVFATLTVCARYEVIFGGLTSMLFCGAALLLTALGLLFIYYYMCIWILQAADSLQLTSPGYTYAWLPFAAFAICLLCWLPYFLYEYPGVMTPDSINQYAQVIGAYAWSNHHSAVHTAMIGFFYSLGLRLTGSEYSGLASYTIAQMAFMAAVAGYVIKTLQKTGVRLSVLILVILFYALMPYNGAYAVTIWKDIPFAGCMTLFAAALMRFKLRGNWAASADDIPRLAVSEYFTLVLPYIASGVLICLLRTNGWYAFLVSVPFILIVYRKCPKVMIPVHLAILLLVLFVKYPVMHVYDIKQADFVESLSVPAQQIARVAAKGETLSAEQAVFAGQLMDLEQVSAVYQPAVSDNVKNLIRERGSGYLETHKAEFFKMWFSIGLTHPKTYFDAYVAQTNGFWYPDVSGEVGLADGIYENEFGLSWQPLIRGQAIIKIKEILFKLPELIPLYGLLWSMGFMFWVVLVLAALGLRSGKTANALVCLPFILLTLTLCAASPVSNEFRYAYPLFYALPVLMLSPFV